MDDRWYSSTSNEYQEHDDDDDDGSMQDCEYFSDDEESNTNRNKPCMLRWKSGKRVDPRLLTTLESFKEIYDNKRDLFKEIFPGMYNEFVDVFKKLGEMTEKNKEAESMEQYRTFERSLSFDSLQVSSRGIELADEFVNEKFKVKPPNVIVGGADGKGGQTVKGGK